MFRETLRIRSFIPDSIHEACEGDMLYLSRFVAAHLSKTLISRNLYIKRHAPLR